MNIFTLFSTPDIPVFLEYLFRSAVWITVWYGFYYFFLRNENSYRLLRLYFLAGIIVSLVFPLISLPAFMPSLIPPAGRIFPGTLPDIPAQTSSDAPAFPSFYYFLFMGYIIGVIILSIKFLWELFSLYVLIRLNPKRRQNGVVFVYLKQNVSPFSFFYFLFINPDLFTAGERESIIRHEKAHVYGWHTLDLLVSQVFVIFQWFNPFAWLFRQALLTNLEFIADAKAQKSATNPASYQKLLLKTATLRQNSSLGNSFQQSQLKIRIMKLQLNQHKRPNYLKLVAILPVILLVLLAFNTKDTASNKISAIEKYVGELNKETGYINLEKETYFYVIENGECRFYDKWGQAVPRQKALLLLKKLQKEKNNNALKLAPGHLSQDSARQTGYLHYDGQTYYYIKSKSDIKIFDRFGKPVDKSTEKQLRKQVP